MKKIILGIILAFTILLPICALEEALVLGMEDQWQDLEEARNVEFFRSTHGYSDIILKESEFALDSSTDLLLHFNDTEISDITGNYETSENNILISDSFEKAGAGSAVFRGERPGIHFTPVGTKGMLTPGRVWDDFTVEFWLYPASMKNGETVFLFKGSRLVRDKIVPQRIECKFENNRLIWNFENVFLPESQEEFTVSITGKSKLVPRNWHHHQLRFDSGSGLLEYLLDGVPEGIAYANHDGNESGQVYLPYIGTAERGSLLIGIDLTAFIDEFRISSVMRDVPDLTVYSTTYGEITTRFLDLGYSNSSIIRINADYESESNSEIQFYYRTADDFTQILNQDASWIQFLPGKEFALPVSARMVQIKCLLFPDGTGTYSPRLENIQINYIPDLPPLPPERVIAVSGNGQAVVSWTAVAEEDVAGYCVYFGDRPGQYLGKTSGGLSSPINAGNINTITIDGLENGKIYYFSVCAYDSAAVPHVSSFSAEASARPSGLYGD